MIERVRGHRLRQGLVTYLTAIGVAALGVAVAWTISPGDATAFGPPLAAVLIAAAIGGWGAAAMAWLVSVVGSAYFLLPPRNSFRIEDGHDLQRLVIFAAAAVVIGGLGAAMRRSRDGAEMARRDARLAQARAEQARAELQAFGDSAPIGWALFDHDLGLANLNDRFAALGGGSVDDYRGRSLAEVGSDFPAPLIGEIRSVLTTGRDVIERAIAVETPGSGARCDLMASWFAVRADPSQSVGGIGVIALDVTLRVRAEDRLRLLSDLSLALDHAGPIAERLARLAELVVPTLADRCAVYLPAPDGVDCVAAAGEGQILRSAESEREARAAVVITTGETLREGVTPAPSGNGRPENRAAGGGDELVVPMIARGRTFGALVLTRARSASFSDAAIALAHEVGRRAAVALDNSRLVAEARATAAREEARALALDDIAAASLAVYRVRSLDERLTIVAERARALTDAGRSLVMVVERGGWSRPRVAASSATGADEPPATITAPAGIGAYAALAANQRPVRLSESELADHPRWRSAVVGATPGRPVRGLLALPLVGRGGLSLGVLQVSDRADGAFSADDQTIITELARIAALAIENARVEARERDVATSLQAGLLPRDLPAIPGVETAARHVAGTEGMTVGGDFYDMFATDGQWSLVIGDVCGKGAEAATLTSLARHTLRAEARHDSDPREVLRQLNSAVLEQGEDGRFLTALFGRLDRVSGGIRAQVSCAGHPPPLVVRANGQIEAIDVGGRPLGLFPDVDIGQVTIDLAIDDTLLFHTDGVTEARGSADIFGERRLRAVLADSAGCGAEEMVERIVESAERHRGAGRADDIAVVALRVRE